MPRQLSGNLLLFVCGGACFQKCPIAGVLCDNDVLWWAKNPSSCRIPQKQAARKSVLFVFVVFDVYFSSRASSHQVGRRHCAVERVLWTMQRNGATQAQGVEGRRPCANAQRPCAQSRDRFLTFCLLCLYGWLATGQQLSARCAGCSETEN